MIVNRDHLYNALDMAIEDSIEVDNHINHDELSNLKTRFSRLLSQLMEDVEDRLDEDSEDDESDDDTKDDVDD